MNGNNVIENLKVTITEKSIPPITDEANIKPKEQTNNRFYHKEEKIDLRKVPRTWRTRKDPFKDVWPEIRLRLELNPEHSPLALLTGLIDKYPGKFKTNQVRTLQRRISDWQKEQQGQDCKLREIMLSQDVQTPSLESLEFGTIEE